MAVKIRLQRKGRKKFPFYHIVIADSRSPRDGKFIENIGVYNPMTKPATIELDRDKAYDWMTKGAQPTETVRAILRFKGVLFRKHLMDGVTKGAHTEEQAMAKYNAWLEDKETKIRKRREHTESEKEAFRKAVSGSVPKIVIKQDSPAAQVEKTEDMAVEEETAVEVETTKTAEETPAVEETAAVEEAPAEEANAPEVEETTAIEATPEAVEKTEEGAPAVEESASEVAVTPAIEVTLEAVEKTEEEAPTAESSASEVEKTPTIEETPDAEEKPADQV
jgi:small subunit ribosomal protein S16